MSNTATTPTTAISFEIDGSLYNRLSKEPDAEVINKAGKLFFKFYDDSIGFIGNLQFSYRKITNWNLKGTKVNLFIVL